MNTEACDKARRSWLGLQNIRILATRELCVVAIICKKVYAGIGRNVPWSEILPEHTITYEMNNECCYMFQGDGSENWL